VIAERLGLSPKTVANYVSLILVKLGAEDRHDAARMVRSLREQQG
jgi:DNA-binding NarL/FixJ family response regulator